LGGIVPNNEQVKVGIGASMQATTWPYLVGLGSLLVGAAGFLFAPISGIVYLALPGVILATLWAFASESPARAGLALSAGAFVFGIVVLVVGFASLAGDNFFAQEWGFAAGLLVLPILGLVAGFPSVLVARTKPGHPPVWISHEGQAE
jgi:hypothetical protein